MSLEIKSPCGKCDIGTYCMQSMLNKKAREFSILDEKDRVERMPRCKSQDKDCVGATHFHVMLINIDNQVLRNESLEESK